jgi:1-deoxy-D-xylulose 5-phosphate reductoisomerase (EC 1.1.1.267)
MKSVTILGSTGSIGANTLAVLALHPEQFRVFALAAHSNADKLFAQCLEFRPNYAVLGSAQAASSLQQRLRAEHCPTEVLSGPKALDDVAAAPEVDLVMAAIVGAAGLSASLAAARAGKRLLLANKESLVVAGDLLLQALAQGGGDLIPIDSEHSAIQQSLPDDRSRWQADVRNIVLTASGGPFRQRAAHSLQAVTPTEACAHPNWSMGAKISVDSATMMNKALEVIEAHYLFGMRPEQIEVLIHPQSIVHSMVNYHDGSVIAQLGQPDMRTPYCLRPVLSQPAWPRARRGSTWRAWDGSISNNPIPSGSRAWPWPSRRCACRWAPAPCSMPPTKWPWTPSSISASGLPIFTGSMRICWQVHNARAVIPGGPG